MPDTTLSYGQLTDLQLFGLIKQDDTHAFEILYNRYWVSLTDTAYKRLQTLHKSEDLVQEVFISFYQRRKEIDIAVSIQAYLHQALKYKILNEFRSQKTQLSYEQSVAPVTECRNNFVKQLDARELHHQIERIITALPDQCRKVFVLSRKENQSNREIADTLNISVSTVEKHITRALKTFRTTLSAYAS